MALSEKMQLLEKLLTKLLPFHKVLIFSHFKEMLDILQEYLTIKGIKFCRLDTFEPYKKRESIVEQFNNSSSYTLVMLLSMQVGALHVSASAADVVIFFDSDCNPFTDEQYVSRIHKTGVTNHVLLFRLITRYTIEHRLIEIAKAKTLEKTTIKPNKPISIDFKDVIKSNIDKVFAEDASSDKVEYTNEELDNYLKMPLHVEENDECDYLNSFKNAPFEIVNHSDDQAFENIINEENLKMDSAIYAKLNITNDTKQPSLKKKKLEDNNINELKCAEEISKSSSAPKDIVKPPIEETKKEASLKKQSSKANSNHKNKQVKGKELTVDMHAIMVDLKNKEKDHLIKINTISKTFCDATCKLIAVEIIDGNVIIKDNGTTSNYTYCLDCVRNDLRCQLITWGFNEVNRVDFVSAIMKYGVIQGDWASLYHKIKSNEHLSSINAKKITDFECYAHNFSISLNALVKQQKEVLHHTLCSVYLPSAILERISDLSAIYELTERFKASPSEFKISNSVVFEDASEQMKSNNINWGGAYDTALLLAILKHGYGELEKILEDSEIWPFLAGCTNKNGIYSQWIKTIMGEMEQEITESTAESIKEDCTEYCINIAI